MVWTQLVSEGALFTRLGRIRKVCIAQLVVGSMVGGLAQSQPQGHGGDFLDATRTMDCVDAASCLAIARDYYRQMGVDGSAASPRAIGKGNDSSAVPFVPIAPIGAGSGLNPGLLALTALLAQVSGLGSTARA